MFRTPAWRRYARFFGADVRRDVDDELEFHLAAKIRDLVARGLGEDEARREALRQFGDVEEMRRLCESWGQTRERVRERERHWAAFRQDLGYALRTLRKSPVFTFVAVASMALGIGANTAIFTLLDRVLLRSLPVSRPAELVQVAMRGYYYGNTYGSGRELSHPLYLELRDHNQVFAGMFASWRFRATVKADAAAETASAELVTGSYFPTLGVGAIRGRMLTPDDDRAPGASPVVVISHGYWQRRFAADPQIVGRRLLVGPQPMTIVGVVEPGFDGLDLTTGTELFVPASMKAETVLTGPRLDDRSVRWLEVFARLKPGVAPAAAQAGLAPLHRARRELDVKEPWFAKAAPAARTRYVEENHLEVVPSPGGTSAARGRLQRPLWMLMAIVAGVLLIACANVANLLLARGASRQRELAIRLSLGATRGRVVRQLLVESLCLALAGGALGVLLATAGLRVVLGVLGDPDSVQLIGAEPDPRVLLFAFTVALLTATLFGLVPAWQSTRPDVAPTLKDQASSVVSGGHVRLRKALVVSQVALSLLLLTGAGLFIRSLATLTSLDLGFRRERLLTFGVDATISGRQEEQVKQYAMEVLRRVGATPGVSAAGFAGVGVLQGGAWGTSIAIEGHRPADDERVGSRCNVVSPGYFTAMGIPLLMGRDFTEQDHLPRPPEVEGGEFRVAIASESFVKRYIPGNPIGRHIGLGADPGTPTPIEIVGVVKDSTYTRPQEERQWQLYFPFLESSEPGTAWFYVRTAQDPAPMLDTLRRVVRTVDPDVPVMALRTMDAQLQRTVVDQRLIAVLTATFGLLATTLAMVGLYGVMAYTVTRRTREIGIRVALGAHASRVTWLILREGMTLVVAGMAVAVPLTWWLGRYVESELHGVAAADPAAVGIAAIALAVVAAAASFGPSLRAARLDPIRALRQD